MPATGRDDRHAGVHEGQGGAADAGHGAGAVRLQGLRDQADGVGEGLLIGDDGHERPLGQGTVADLAPTGPAHEARLAHAEGRELVMVHEALGFLDVEAIDTLLVPGRSQRQQREYLGLAPGEETGAVGARSHPHFAGYGADLLGGTTVGPLLLHGDLATHRLLLHGVESLGQSRRVGGRVDRAFGRRPRRQCFLLQSSESVRPLVLVEHRAGPADVCGETSLDLVHEERIGQPLGELHLGLAFPGRPSADGFALLLDGLMRHLEAGDDVRLVDLLAARLHHADSIGGTGDHEIHRALVDLLIGGVHDPGTVDLSHSDGAHRPMERGFGQTQCRRGARDGQDVVGVGLIDRKHRRHYVRLFVEAFRPQRPDGPVDEARVQDGLIAGPSLFLYEAAGDLPRGVHPCLHVHREGEEIHVPFVARDHSRDQHHGVARADDHGPTRLLRQPACLERDPLVA